MKILITSGGTKIPIDTVRSITNMSHGTLGSRMAKECLEAGHEVIFFRAEGSKSPMSMNADFMHYDDSNSGVEKLKRFYLTYKDNYTEETYKTFEDYKFGLEEIIFYTKPDVIILASAVSDYGVEAPMQGKIRTKDNLSINLTPLPKVISSVREWAGEEAIIVGFKLLVDSTEEELISEAMKSLVNNKLDYVCANDLRTILNGDHRLWLIDKSDKVSLQHSNLTSTLLHWMEYHHEK